VFAVVATSKDTAMKTTTITLPGLGYEANDALLDLVNELGVDKHRNRNMERAHACGLDACEVCGRALRIKETRVECLDEAGECVAVVGPDCAKKLAAALAADEGKPS
jgi:hypothetical protein